MRAISWVMITKTAGPMRRHIPSSKRESSGGSRACFDPIVQTPDSLVPNLESGELSAGRLRINLLVADVADQPLADVVEEREQLVLFSFGHQLDLPVREVANEAIHRVPLGDGLGRVAEADALDVAAVKHGLS
jgi:hypothetical protein